MFASFVFWIAVLAIVVALLLTVLIRHRRHRKRTLAALAAERSDWVRHHPVVIASIADPVELARAFARDPILRIEGFLQPGALQSLRAEAELSIPRMKRTYIQLTRRAARSATRTFTATHTAASVSTIRPRSSAGSRPSSVCRFNRHPIRIKAHSPCCATTRRETTSTGTTITISIAVVTSRSCCRWPINRRAVAFRKAR